MAQRSIFTIAFAILFLFTAISAASVATPAQAPKTGILTGIVRDLNGITVNNATVTIENSAIGYTRTTNSDEKGSFRFIAVPPTRYELCASAPGFRVTRGAVSVRSEGVNFQSAILLQPAQQTGTAALRGTVSLGDNGQPVHDATVTILQLRLTTYTDENGKYEFPAVPFGRYDVAAHLSGVPDAVQSVEVRTSNANTLDIHLQLTGMRGQETVTATGQQQAVSSSIQSVDVIGSTDLAKKNPASLGAALESEAGV